MKHPSSDRPRHPPACDASATRDGAAVEIVCTALVLALAVLAARVASVW